MRLFLYLTCMLYCSVMWACELIDVFSAESLRSHAPVVVGHRGGAVVEGIPENSLQAMRLAAKRGYSMVEIDVRATLDGVPVASHDSEMEKHVGVAGSIEEATVAELSELHYLEGEEFPILTVEESLAEASRLQLGVMLDIKSGQENEVFPQQIDEFLQRYGLTRATLTISRHENTRRYLANSVMQRVSGEDFERVKRGEQLDLSGQVWFNWPRYISNDEVARLQSMGAIVVPSINVFHYPEATHLERAKADIERMREAGVDAYQIDAPYDQFVMTGE